MSSKIFRALGLESAIPEEGRTVNPTEPTETPAPTQEPTPAATPEPAPAPAADPAPEPTPATQQPTPEPTAAPVPAGDPQPSPEPTPEPQPAADPAPEEPADDGEDLDFEGGSEINTELADTAQAHEEAEKTVVTLESIVDILSQASEDQLNETTAAIVAAAIDDVNDRYEFEKAPEISMEGYRMVGAATFRSSATESMKEKVEQLKSMAKGLIDKIIEMIQRFWQWLTLNKKRLAARLAAAEESLKGVDGEAEVKASPIWRTVAGDSLTITALVKNGRTLEMATSSAAVFIGTGFEAYSSLVIGHMSDTTRYAELARKAFSNFSEVDGKIELYNNIGGRALSIELTPENATRPFSVRFSKTEQGDMADALTVSEHDADVLMKQARLTADVSVKGFEKIDRTISVLKRVTNINTLTATDAFTKQTQTLRSYSSALSVLVEGCFTQSLRYSNVAVQVVERYVAARKKAAGQIDTGNTQPLLAV